MSENQKKGNAEDDGEKKFERNVLFHNKRPQVIHVPVTWQAGMVTAHKDVLPGINSLPAGLVEQMRKHPVLKHHFDDEEFVVIEEAGKPVPNISGLQTKKAKSIISDTVDLNLLRKWQEDVKPGEIARALQMQIDKIEKPDSKEEGSGRGKGSKDGE